MSTILEKLSRAVADYYDSEESMSDKEFDDLVSRLLKKGIDVNDVLGVGYAPNDAFKKIEHDIPSLSLDKTKDRKEIERWLGVQNGVLSWKCDGITIIIVYENGKLQSVATRGNGLIGECVEQNFKFFNILPETIIDPRKIIIRGEAVVYFDDFLKFNDELPIEKQYKNPRSMASGLVRTNRLYYTYNSFPISFIPFDLANSRDLGFSKFSEGLKFIAELGFVPVQWKLVDRNNLIKTINQMEDKAKDQLFSTDGLVVVFEDLDEHSRLGCTNRHPRYAMAFKWGDILKTTTLRNIEWSVAKSGLITPVAVFDPVELCGTTIKRASLYNLNVMQELGIGIGDHIRVYKANMIVPQIYEDLEKTENYHIPIDCPVCGKPVEVREGSNGKSKFLYCSNPKCPSRGKVQKDEEPKSESSDQSVIDK